MTSQDAANVLLVAHQFARTKAKPPSNEYMIAFDQSLQAQLGRDTFDELMDAIAEIMGEKWPDASWYGG